MQCWWVQTYTGGKQPVKLKLLFCFMYEQESFVLRRDVTSFSYDGFFSVFFYACASRSYDAFFSYHKAYSNNLKNLVYNKFSLSLIILSHNYTGSQDYFESSFILFSISIFASGRLMYDKLLRYQFAAAGLSFFRSYISASKRMASMLSE